MPIIPKDGETSRDFIERQYGAPARDAAPEPAPAPAAPQQTTRDFLETSYGAPAIDNPPSAPEPPQMDASTKAALEDYYARRVDQARLGAMFKEDFRQGDRASRILSLMQLTGRPRSEIEGNVELIEAAVEQSKNDPKAFQQEHPDLAKYLLQNLPAATAVLQDPAVKKLGDALRQGDQVATPAFGGFSEAVATISLGAAQLTADAVANAGDIFGTLAEGAKAGGTVVDLYTQLRDFYARAGERAAATVEGTKWVEAHEVLRTVGKDSDREGLSGFVKPIVQAWQNGRATAAEGKAGADALVASIGLLNAKTDADRQAAEKRLFEARAAAIEARQSRDEMFYDPGTISSVLADTANLTASSLESGAVNVAGGLASLGLGLLFPEGAVALKVGQGLVVGATRLTAAGSEARTLSGQMFLDLSEALPDSSLEERVALSISFGAAAAGVSVLPGVFNLQAWGPLGAAIASGNGKALAAALTPSMRQAFARAGRAVLKNAAGEAGEEIAQDSLEKAYKHFYEELATGQNLEEDWGQVFGELAQTGVTTVTGVLGGAGPKVAANVATQVSRKRAGDLDAMVVPAIREAMQGTLARAPEAFAGAVAASTKDGIGREVTAFYVDPELLLQQSDKDPNLLAVDLMGESGPRRLQQAAATGVNLEVPVAEWAATWQKLLQIDDADISTRPDVPTRNQTLREQETVEAEAKKIVAAAKGDGGGVPPSSEKEAAYIAKLERELAAAPVGGKLPDAEAVKTQVAMQRARLRTTAARWGLSLDTVLDLAQLDVESRTEASEVATLAQQTGHRASELGLEGVMARLMGAETDPTKATDLQRAIFFDPNTKLYNQVGWDLRKAPEGAKWVIEYDLEGKKSENDLLGHLTLDGDLRTMANLIAERGAVGAKMGASIFEEAGDDEASAREIAEATAREMSRRLGGLRVTTSITPRQVTLEQQLQAAGAVSRPLRDAEVKAGRLAHRKGIPVAFTQATDPKINWDWDDEKAETQKPELGFHPEGPEAKALQARYAEQRKAHAQAVQKAASAVNLDITPEMAASLAGRSPQEIARSLFVEKETGLITQAGWDFLERILPPAESYLSADMRALKALNAVFIETMKARGKTVKEGEALADKVMAYLGQVMARNGGAALMVAHLHGDEYAARLPPGYSPDVLQKWSESLNEMASMVKLYLVRDDTSVIVVDGVEIASGLGESFKKADDTLNATKPKASEVKRKPEVKTFASRKDRDAYLEKIRSERNAVGEPAWADLEAPAPAPVGGVDLFAERPGDGVERDVPRAAAQERVPPGAPLESRSPGDWSLSPRGWFLAAENQTGKAVDKIALVAEQANYSTFLHESSHQYLLLLDRLSKLADAPPAVKRDLEILLKHLGATSLSNLTREQQEKFARSAEKYFEEGKAPSVELQPVFKRFKSWLRRIYRRVKNQIELTDEVRGVFDRMFATDDEIARVKEKGGQNAGLLKHLGALVADGLLTQGEMDRYFKDRAEAESVATKAGKLGEMKKELRAKKKDLADARAEWSRAAGREYDAKPEARTLEFLKTGVLKDADGTVLENAPGFTLDRTAVEMMLGEEGVEKLRPYLSALRDADAEVEAGVHPDDLAERIGYMDGTGGQLLRDVLALQPRADFIREKVKAEEERNFDLLEARDQVAAEVAKGLHGDQTLSWMLTEWKALAGRAGSRQSRIRLQAIKRAAKMMADEQAFMSVRPSRILQAERAAADAATAAAAAGNYGLALAHQERRLLNAALYRELLEAVKLKEKLLDRAKEMSTDRVRARLGKAHLALRDGADEILETLGFVEPRRRDEPLRGMPALRAAFDELHFTIVYDSPRVELLLANKRGWRTLTVGEARAVYEALREIDRVAGRTNMVRRKGKLVDLDDAVAELVAEAEANKKDRPLPASSDPAASLKQKAVETLTGIEGNLLQMVTILDELGGGGIDSAFRQYLYDSLQDAKQREYDLVNTAVKPVVELFKKLPPGVKRRWNEKIDGRALFPNHKPDVTPPTRRFELLTLALNAGNESNLERLLNGRGIRQEQLQAALDLLTEEEMEWVQSVLDAIESLWPLSADLEERETGLRPKKIEATPIVWRGQRAFRGGYFPMIYDRRFPGEHTGDKQALDTLFDSGFQRPGTNHNHLKKRADHFNDAVSLDPRHLSAHLTQVAHDIAFREALREAGQIVTHKKFKDAMKKKLGAAKEALFLRWLKDIGHARAAVPETGAKEATDKIRELRGNFGVATLGYALDIASGDLSNTAVAAADRVNLGHLTKAVAECAGTGYAEKRAFALKKSGELRFRATGLARELRNQIDRMASTHGLEAGALAWWKEHAFALQEVIDEHTATPVWLAGYRQGLDEAAGKKGLVGPEAEEYAVRFADDVIRRSFPSHSPVDQSAVMRDRGFVGTMLLFHGYFNLIYQRNREDLYRIVKAFEGGATADAFLTAGRVTARMSGRLLGRTLAVFVLGNFLSGRGPAEGEPPEEWVLRSLLLEQFMLLPFGDAAVGAVEAALLGKRPNVRAAPGLAALYEVSKVAYKMAEGKETTVAAKAAAGAKLAAMLTGIPGTRPIRTAQYLFEAVEGRPLTEKTGALAGAADIASQAIYGPDSKYKRADPFGTIADVVGE